MIPQKFDINALTTAENKDFLQKMILQVKKDVQMVGSDLELDPDATADELVRILQTFLLGLIKNDFTTYVNLLYRIDIPEQEILGLQDMEVRDVARSVSLLILKKEWQKVWFRSRN